MADDRRVYSDEEFALILRKAADLARRKPASIAPSWLRAWLALETSDIPARWA